MKNDITTRKDIEALITCFYELSFQDERLGKIFKEISPLHLETHIPLVADFWEGILNGINEEEWNPKLDKKIYQNYSIEDVEKGKLANKLALYQEYGLHVELHRPLIGLIGRLTHQKGFDTFLNSFYQKWKLPFYYFILGSGEVEGWNVSVAERTGGDEEVGELYFLYINNSDETNKIKTPMNKLKKNKKVYK